MFARRGWPPGPQAAVRQETSEPAAAALFDALCGAVDPSPEPASVTCPRPWSRRSAPVADSDRLRVLFLSPLPAFGGHATIIRSFLRRLCDDPRRPAVTVVAAADAGPEAGLMHEVLAGAGADRTRVVPMHLVDAALAEEVGGVDVVYSVWPTRSRTAGTYRPADHHLIDMNWRTSTICPRTEPYLDAETPRWLAPPRSSARRSSSPASSRMASAPTRARSRSSPRRPRCLRRPVRHGSGTPPPLRAPRTVHALSAQPPEQDYAVLHAACRWLRRAGRGSRWSRPDADGAARRPDLIGLGYVDAAELRALMAPGGRGAAHAV